MKRNTTWIAGLALAVAVAGCGDAVDGAADSDAAPESTTTEERAELVSSTDEAAATTATANSQTTNVDSPTSLSSPATATTEGDPVETTDDIAIQTPADGLDQTAVDGLLWMREEEKLARDVYLALAEMWDLPIFANIAGSEQTHTDAVGGLLESFGIPDPMAVDTPGVFEDPTIQALYDGLIDQGSQSLVDALIVGATIEDMDIVDLQLRQSGVEAIDQVYGNLEKGSRNHLRAFIRALDRQGGEYAPRYLSIAEYEAIITSPVERGRAEG